MEISHTSYKLIVGGNDSVEAGIWRGYLNDLLGERCDLSAEDIYVPSELMVETLDPGGDRRKTSCDVCILSLRGGRLLRGASLCKGRRGNFLTLLLPTKGGRRCVFIERSEYSII
jgi:hypothetical protein